MKKSYILGSVKEGKFSDLPELLKAFYSHEGKEVMVTVERFYEDKTYPQLKYIFGGLCKPIAYELYGKTNKYYVDKVYLMLKLMFLQEEVPGGKGLFTIKGLSECNKLEASNFINEIRDCASAEMNLYLPSPEEYKHDHPEIYGVVSR